MIKLGLMKIIAFCIILFCLTLTGYSQEMNKFNFKGNVNYIQQNSNSLINHMEYEYRVGLWESNMR